MSASQAPKRKLPLRPAAAAPLLLAAAALLAAVANPAGAADLRVSGFGTIGYAATPQRDLTYLRYINRDGTLKADSLAGVQAEVQLSPQWGATVQAVASAPRTRDDGVEAKLRWAFLSWRPDSDWLIRAGRVRPPFFFNTQNAEVGVTYDQARLPVEVYALSPIYDFDGVNVTKTWALEDADLSVDAYWGRSDVSFRDHFQLEPPALFFKERITAKGVVIAYSGGALALRAGAHHARLRATGGELFPATYAPSTIPAPPPFGGTLFLPDGLMEEVDAHVLTLGAIWRSGNWQATMEYGQRKTPDSNLVVNDKGAYVTVSHALGAWTPYATYARLRSGSETRAAFAEVKAAPVPLVVVGMPFSVNFHRFLADRIAVYDQHSVMLGSSYRFSATSKLKLEWMRTHVGLVSAYVDGDVGNRSFNVLSVSWSVAF